MPYILLFLVLVAWNSSAVAATKKEMLEFEKLVRTLAKRPHGDVAIVVRADSETGDIRVAFSKIETGTRLEMRFKEILNFVKVTRTGASVQHTSVQVDVTTVDRTADGVVDEVRLAFDEQDVWRGPQRDALSDNQSDYDNAIQVVSGHLRSLLKMHVVNVQKRSRRK